MSTAPAFFLGASAAGAALPLPPFLGAGVGASRSSTSSAWARLVMPRELDTTAEARMLTATRRIRNMNPLWKGGEARPQSTGAPCPEGGAAEGGLGLETKSLITTGRYNPQGCGM